MARQGLKMLDVRHTLPNLKYLLYFLTAGVKEVPGRKEGGVRGLVRGGDENETPLSMSRSESQGSVRVGEEFRIWGMVENGEMGKGKGMDPLLLGESLKTGSLKGAGLGVSL